MRDAQWVTSRVTSALGGDVEAFGELVEEFQGPVRGFVAMLGVPADANEDVAQDVFIEAFRSLGTYDAGYPFDGWLRGIARNLALRHHTAQARTRRGSARLREFLAESCAALEGERPIHGLDALRECMKQLTGRAADLISMRYAQGQTSREIAYSTNQDPVAVRMALSRIRTALRDCITVRLNRENAR